MLSRRLTSEAQPRAKNGPPHHSTTGVASTNSIQMAARGGSASTRCPAIAMTTSGTDNANPTQKRRIMSRSSGLAVSPAAGVIGSSAMPQIGQLPGSDRTISGCIGQVH